MHKCCVDGCNYIAIHISKIHYLNEHNMTRKEAELKYGKKKWDNGRIMPSTSGFNSDSFERSERELLMKKLR